MKIWIQRGLLSCLFAFLCSLTVFGSAVRGKIGAVYLEDNQIFFSVHGENRDNCEGFFISRDHFHFNEVFSILLSYKSLDKEVTVWSEKRCTEDEKRVPYQKIVF